MKSEWIFQGANVISALKQCEPFLQWVSEGPGIRVPEQPGTEQGPGGRTGGDGAHGKRRLWAL